MSIFSAIGGLVGGLLGNKSADKRQNEMLAWQERMDNTKIQRLQADAKAAGVHPLAAMGTSLSSPSPTVVGGRPDFADMGQNIGRAVDATMSTEEKQSDADKVATALKLKNMDLQNQVIEQQLANSAATTVNMTGTPPGYSAALAKEILRQDVRGEAEARLRERDPLGMGPIALKQNRRWSPSQKVEDEYSDVVSNVYGVLKFMRDYNLSTRPQKGDWNYPLTKRYWQEKWNQNQARTDGRYLMRRRGDHGYW